MKSTFQIIAVATLITAVAALSGCNDSTAPAAPPGIQPEIVNIADSFEYQVKSIDRYTGGYSYTWENTGTKAAIDHSSVVSKGVGTVAVYDSDGTEVYNGEMSASGSLQTLTGAAGNWTITVTYAIFSGTVNFRVQKA